MLLRRDRERITKEDIKNMDVKSGEIVKKRRVTKKVTKKQADE